MHFWNFQGIEYPGHVTDDLLIITIAKTSFFYYVLQPFLVIIGTSSGPFFTASLLLLFISYAYFLEIRLTATHTPGTHIHTPHSSFFLIENFMTVHRVSRKRRKHGKSTWFHWAHRMLSPFFQYGVQRVKIVYRTQYLRVEISLHNLQWS